MNNANNAEVITLPAARAVPVRTLEFTHSRGARAVDVVREEQSGCSPLWFVVVRRIFTGEQTVIGGFYSRGTAVLQAKEELR